MLMIENYEKQYRKQNFSFSIFIENSLKVEKGPKVFLEYI